MLNQANSAVYYNRTFLADDTPLFTKPAFEYQETTMQVPMGDFSILSEWFEGRLKPIEAITLLSLNHRSTWVNGKTYWAFRAVGWREQSMSRIVISARCLDDCKRG